MKPGKSLIRKTHFLGTKIRNLRKRNNLTLDDLSIRCMRIDPEHAPSVSYLSMIERGKRIPGSNMLNVIAEVFQKDIDWFLDDTNKSEATVPDKGKHGGIKGISLEPGFLFANENLQIAIPEMLSQTGITGRQFAHLLIRAYQERHQNHFPDLERAAEDIGLKRLPLRMEDIKGIAASLGLTVKWFSQVPEEVMTNNQFSNKTVVTSFLDNSRSIYLNELLNSHPDRLKYDMAVHIGHCLLHDNNTLDNVMVAGSTHTGSFEPYSILSAHSATVESQDILQAWHDFESSFFAGALLCPKVPFRQLLDRKGYEISVHNNIGVSPAVAMRRMTAVSPYSYWHYFDAYPPGKLKAVYRGNGIPLPWGNMRAVEDPCQHWSVFRMIQGCHTGTAAQISILDVDNEPRIYCCESIKVKDLAGNAHVLCMGIDLNPAIEVQGDDAKSMAHELKSVCVSSNGAARIPKTIRETLLKVSRILNIHWIERGIHTEARVICIRGSLCPQSANCFPKGRKQDAGGAIKGLLNTIKHQY